MVAAKGGLSAVAAPSLYDTNILIDYLNGVRAARTELAATTDRAISSITWIEVMVGTPSAFENSVRRFLATFRLLAVTPEVAERTVAIRKTMKLKLPDAIIFATAQEDGRTLVTRNTRDFGLALAGIKIPYKI